MLDLSYVGTGCSRKCVPRHCMTVFCCLSVVSIAVSCSSGSAKLYPVSGIVTVNGSPLAAGSVTLYADVARGNATMEIPGGEIKNGKYELFTGQKAGAPAGFYKVVVISTTFSGKKIPTKGATAQMPRSLINVKYGDPGRTPLTFEVVAGPEAGAYDLEVTK